LKKLLIVIAGIFLVACIQAQTLTGVWKGKINGSNAEAKLVQKGDSITGTSYYTGNFGNYKRYSLKGYFDANTNEVVWWDDVLLEEKKGKLIIAGSGETNNGILSRADFNCPGEDEMFLDGSSNNKNFDKPIQGELHLKKVNRSTYEDDWNWIIENYTMGGNNPQLIDSIAQQQTLVIAPVKNIETTAPQPIASNPSTIEIQNENKPAIAEVKPATAPAPVLNNTNLQKFNNRKKILNTVIPLTGNSIELNFYDNAQIDGDSIALFLNNKLIFEHVRLTGEPFMVKLDADDLQQDNELVMVAENLGSIPPNTSYMLAKVGGKRYEVFLSSGENSSATIRFVKKNE
jgi:hypothetical protein